MNRIFLISTLFLNLYAERGVCIVPVADLVGAPLSINIDNSTHKYKALPINGDAEIVKRIGQLLFNDVIDIIDQYKDELCISTLNQFYCTTSDKKPRTNYWTHKKNILPLSKIKNKECIPIPLNFKNKTSESTHKYVTLKKPFFDHKNNRLFSAGTRFKKIPDHQDKKTETVSMVSKKTLPTTLKIPKSYLTPHNLSQQEEINLFIQILKEYAHLRNGKIPYVFGGNSLAKQDNKPCKEKFITKNGNRLNFFTTNENQKGPYTGVDCASLIYRCAQIAGLPFFTKNSSAIYHHLRPLQKDEEIENGDIIYIPGHIMAVTDKDRNLIVESRTQSHGYGFVHEIAVEKLFKEIETLDDIKKYHFSKRSVTRINKEKKSIGKKTITILKLTSIFEN
jgi:hypothetical protein